MARCLRQPYRLVNSIYRFLDEVRGFLQRYSLRFTEQGRSADGSRWMAEALSLSFSRACAMPLSRSSWKSSLVEPTRSDFGACQYQVGDNYFRVTALDLHVTSRGTFEIAPDWMRVYLTDETCEKPTITPSLHQSSALLRFASRPVSRWARGTPLSFRVQHLNLFFRIVQGHTRTTHDPSCSGIHSGGRSGVR